jgi:hypothetical protein
MLKIAVGPEIDAPSWNWVGFDMARELAKYFSVKVFADTIPACDLVLIIKRRPASIPSGLRHRIIYFPIDQYESPAAIRDDHEFLRSCGAIGCHSESLIPYLQRYCQQVFFIEHHARYSLPTISPYKKDGYILWIGGIQYIPYLLKWLFYNPVPRPIKLLTNLGDYEAQRACFSLANDLAIVLDLSSNHINGYEAFEWSERLQYHMMLEASAAVDIKGGAWLGSFHWSQYMKPPTKAQKFVSSGIPFATNCDSYCFQYFSRRDFSLATPIDVKRWFSREYWQETAALAAVLREKLSLANIGTQLQKRVLATVT